MPSSKNIKWATYLNEEEDANARRLLEYLWKTRVLDRKTPYSLVKYLISWGVDMMDKEVEQYNVRETGLTEEVS